MGNINELKELIKSEISQDEENFSPRRYEGGVCLSNDQAEQGPAQIKNILKWPITDVQVLFVSLRRKNKALNTLPWQCGGKLW